MSTARDYNPHYTVDDYMQWEGDWELWRGVAISMSPSAFGNHASVHSRLNAALVSALDDANCDATALTEIDWIIDTDTVVRPDLTIVCGGPPKQHVEDTPALVVEVISPSSRERDTVRKRVLFEAESVPWYLIADPEAETLTVLRLDRGTYSELTAKDTIHVRICDDCDLTIDLTNVFR